MIAERLIKLRNQLPESVTLVAVSKTKPVSALQEAYEAGQRDFGENKVQEMVDKKDRLPDDIRWHLIGQNPCDIGQNMGIKRLAPQQLVNGPRKGNFSLH